MTAWPSIPYTPAKPKKPTMTTKPMLAGEAVADKLTYPLYASPKLDGIRGIVHEGRLLARSLKPIPNKHTYAALSRPEYEGLDGELIVGKPNASDVYRNTTSAIMGHGGAPEFTLYVFDLHNVALPYQDRLNRLAANSEVFRTPSIKLLPQTFIERPEDLILYELDQLAAGYEGVILRSPHGHYKYGRSTSKEGLLLKLKRFTDGEAEVIGYEEEMHNTNEAVKNELGRTKRSTAKAGLVGKGTLGALRVRDMKSGVEFNIGSGFTAHEKHGLWMAREKLIGALVKYKSFPVGVKDAPRHPVFLGFRDRRDMGE